VRAVQECVEILKIAGSGKRNDYIGQLYQVKGHQLTWLTAERPAVYVGANMPQMLKMAARVADGVMMSDMPPALASVALDQLTKNLAEKDRRIEDFWSGSFTAWHVYADKEQARREACQWMLLRGLFRPWVLEGFLNPDEVALVMNNAQSFVDAFVNQTHVIKNIPDELLDKLVKNLTLTGSLDDVDSLVAHLREYQALGLQAVSLRIYTDPAASIKLIGERVIPALARNH
jgi:alkanesulfonate monooxygenase SsuD/methylene tetrahydromethanopterin reductase-like flavin-dependent oxidoreductase (luciferase family)